MRRRNPLLLGGHDVEGQDGQHGPIHGHGDTHPVQRDPLKERAHVEDGVDGHPCHPDVAGHPRVVAVVAPVGGQVEGHAEAPLTGGQVAPVEGIALLGRGVPGVLADGPRLAGVHSWVRPAEIRRDPRPSVKGVQARHVSLRGEGRNVDLLGCLTD